MRCNVEGCPECEDLIRHGPVMTRVYAMPSADTLQVGVIRGFVERHLGHHYLPIIDPFARDSTFAQVTNDINPRTRATFHMDAEDFLSKLLDEGVYTDAVIFDPPFSPTQMKELYESFGLNAKKPYAHYTHSWTKEKDLVAKLLVPGGVVVTFGWNSCGMGKKRKFRPLELMLVCHGAGHNDTICVAEEKT